MKLFIATMAIIASFSVHAREEYGTYEDNPTKPFDATKTEYETVKITWIRVPKNHGLNKCNEVRANFSLEPTKNAVDGCTIWHENTCIIVTENLTTMHVLGHETRHCFQHNWH